MSTVKGIAALSVYKKVTIIRNPTDTLTYEGADGTLQTITELGEAATTSIPSIAPKAKQDIPTPRITLAVDYNKDVSADFEVPTSYVRYHKPSMKETENSVEYNADEEDEDWLENHPRLGPKAAESQQMENDAINDIIASRKSLSLSMLEQMIDILDKATGFEAIITSNDAEQILPTKMPELVYAAAGDKRALKQMINDVYNYWVQKRSKMKKPLLRRFWPVTASNDTNPHLVFRPREKEKYKLRKKRQNDMDAYRKMKQLRNDFSSVRVMLALIRHREKLNRFVIDLQAELFDQRMYDIIDTSGYARISNRLTKQEVDEALTVPQHFDVTTSASNRKRKRQQTSSEDKSSPVPPAGAATENKEDKIVVAGHNHGTPAPSFLDPLPSRETYKTTWDSSVPFIPSYVDSHPIPVLRFRHRPRVGRGGRVVVDRYPLPSAPNATPASVFTAGEGIGHPVGDSKRDSSLVDMLPEPLDHNQVSQRIEEICIAALEDDNAVDEENDGEAILVQVEDWLNTDNPPPWGEERYTIGPI